MDIGQPIELLRTLQALLAEGHAPDEVLPIFTSNVARVLGLPAKGRIEVGADADLVVLNDAGELTHVMARGALMVEDGEPCRRGPFEAGP